MKKLKIYWHKYKEQAVLIIVSIFLLAGVVQQAIGLTYVLKLTPIILATVTALMIIFWGIEPRKKVILSFIVIFIGILVETIGVKTGLLFGDYSYGLVLGFKLFGVPLAIGVTWLMVTMSAWQIATYDKSLNIYKSYTLAGLLIIMFDLVLEQFAITYGLWRWAGNTVPIYNYFSWLFVSLIIFYIYYKLSPKWQPSIFIAGILPLMSVFFWLMLIIS